MKSHQNSVKISDLQHSTNYEANLIVFLADGTRIENGMIKFSTSGVITGLERVEGGDKVQWDMMGGVKTYTVRLFPSGTVKVGN